MIPVYQEDDLFYFDEESADRPCRFIEKFCIHYEGQHAGSKFILIPWERVLVRTLFGWKWRTTNLRRFKELYLISAKGAGKTPLLAAIGLYMLLGDKEASPHVISMASTSEQAKYTFEAAQRYIGLSPQLSEYADPQLHEIKGIEGTKYQGAKWTKISGQPKGRSGSRPSCIIADEVHEWEGKTAKAYQLLAANAFKRSQPLLLVATNAGQSSISYAWQLHERALRVLDGEIKDTTLLPIIFEAPETLDWKSEEAAKAANPSMGVILDFARLKPALTKAQESPKEEAEYRRLYLTQWPKTSVDRWLDMTLWDAATEKFDPPKDAVLYDAVDMSLNNDLTSTLFIWATQEKYYVDSHFWIPKLRAEEDEAKHGVPYKQWAADGHITLVDSPTINDATRMQIAAYLMGRTQSHKLKAVVYDEWKSDRVVAILEAAHITTVAQRQGSFLWPGCEELSRRLEENSIVIAPNPVLRWCAENAQIRTVGGVYYPVKPNSAGRYAGTRWMKIDGISALVTGLTIARRHAFPKKYANVQVHRVTK